MRTWGVALAMVFCGVMANAASADDPPVLNSLSAANVITDFWVITGSITDENVANCTIFFGDDLAGRSTSVSADGTFLYVALLPNGGIISAKALDSALQFSNELTTDAI
ncbi:MAG: hypothetical protein AAF532_00115 [Planctomycetota bacterium]